MGSYKPSSAAILEEALINAQQQYGKDHAQSKSNHEEACKYMPGGNTRTVLHTSPFPLTVVKAESCHLHTLDGRKYTDFLGEYTAGIYGHNQPVIRQAVENALNQGWNYGGHNLMEVQLAKTICSRFPAIEQVRFVNSGTEANMMALATAVAYTGKRNILLFKKGYHGSTIFGRVNDNVSTILPHEFITGTYNDAEGTVELVNNLPSNSLAAILVEPMMGSGGCFPGSMTFLQTLRQLADTHKALLIFDEVMTSRLTYHGLSHSLGIKPDLMTLGKWVGGGMSFGAFGGRADLMQLYDPRSGKLDHPGTFNNNVFSMTAGVAGCKFLTSEKLSKLNDSGDKMRCRISEILIKHSIDGIVPDTPILSHVGLERSSHQPPKMFVKGIGSLMNIHFAGPEVQLLQPLFWLHMLSNGVYLAPRGFVALNVELSDQDIESFIAAVDSFCCEWEDHLRW